MNNNKCIFIKEYEEPNKKYNIFSFSLFYIKKYLRFYLKKDVDISIKRQNQFMYNLTLNIQNLDKNFFGNDWYIRIFYDKSLFKFKIGERIPWLEFINYHKKNKKIQFVRFNCSDFKNKNNKEIHINLFGTLPRIYPIFEENNLLETIVIFDADNFITNDFFKEILLFKKTDYDYIAFCSKYSNSYYKYEDIINNDNCYFNFSMISFKKKLPHNLWNNILHELKYFEDKEFYKLIDKLNSNYRLLMKDKEYIKYKDFGYGIDEIILNYYIKNYLNNNNYKLKKIRFRPNIISILTMIITYMTYNLTENKKIITNKILKNILKKNYTDNLEEDLEKLYNLYSKNISIESKYKDLLPYINLLRNNYDLIEKLNVPKTILLFIKNINKDDYSVKNKIENKYIFTFNLPFYL